MKWTNPGHEYDQAYQSIESKKAFYLFGAGDYGNQFIKILKDEIRVLGYIDNDEEKQGKDINGLPCLSLAEAMENINDHTGIIITMSQIARIEPITQLKKLGMHQDVDYYLIEEFLSVYYMYKYGKLYMSTISFLPSTTCNLNCRHCLNFNPFADHFYNRDWDELVRDIDLFFSWVDRIMLFHVSGGEPLLYKYTADVIEYLDRKYGDRIDTLRTVTNGTVIPTDEVLQKLARCKVEFTVDDYRDAVPKYRDNLDILTKKFDEYGIKYWVNKVGGWIDLAPERTDYSNLSTIQLIRHRDSCTQSWQELRDGKIYSCNYAAYAQVAGLSGEQDLEETFDLSHCKQASLDDKKKLVEFRLGYTSKGYTEFCKTCRGFKIDNNIDVEPAIQVERGKL